MTRQAAKRLAAAILAACFWGGVLTGPVVAVQPDERLADPALEGRARAISAGLRCLVCQNQSIDDSDAALARDLRLLVRQRLSAGDSDAAARDYLVARYGDFILLKPPFTGRTLLLWLTPAIALAAGLTAVTAARRRRGAVAPLSPDEERRLGEILAEAASARSGAAPAAPVTELPKLNSPAIAP